MVGIEARSASKTLRFEILEHLLDFISTQIKKIEFFFYVVARRIGIGSVTNVFCSAFELHIVFDHKFNFEHLS